MNSTVKRKASFLSNFFDMGLFREGLRQNKVIGIIGLIVSIALSIVTPLGYISTILYTYSLDSFLYYNDISDIMEELYLSFEGYTDFSFMAIVFLILVPIATFRLFNFLTRRNASDYFHSFPQKRSCIFTSYLLSIIFMFFVIVLCFFATSAITYGILYYLFGFTLLKILEYSVQLFIVCILVAVTVATACAMTGNLFSSVIISAVMLAVPRIFITILSASITLGTDYLVFNRLSEFSNINTNLLVALTARSATGVLGTYIDEWIGAPGFIAAIYTLFLAFVTYLIGLIFFIRKHSESAGKASNTPFLQFIFRMIPALPLALIPIVLLTSPEINLQELINKLSDSPFMLFVILSIEIACMTIMMLYEIISTKQFNKVYKALLAMPVFLLIQAVIIGYFSFVGYREVNYAPEANKIDYVVPIEFEDANSWEADFSFDHNLHSIYSYKNTDEETLQLVSELLKDAVENKDSEYTPCSITVAINSGMSTKYRVLSLDETTYFQLKNLFLQDINFKKLYYAEKEDNGIL